MPTRRRSPVEPESIEPHLCSLGLRLDILRRVPFFAALPGDALGAVNRLFRERGYGPGETIFFAGDEVRRLYVLVAGKVKLIRHTLAGHDVLVDLLTPGEFFGNLSALGDDLHPDTAQAQTEVCVLSVEADAFRRIVATHPEVALGVLDVMAARLKAAHEMVRQLSAHSAEQRIAHVLLKLAEKLGEEQEVGLLIQMPLSREDLAAMSGTTTETASRIVSQLQKEGVIQTGRQWMAIADRAALVAVAERLDA